MLPRNFRAEEKQAREDFMLRKQQAMTSEQIDEAIRKAIHASLDSVGAVSRDDLLRANIPPDEIAPRFKRILAEVLVERKKAARHG